MDSSNLPIGRLDLEAIARRLEAIRERTLSLVAVLDWPTLRRQHVPILSPMVWDLGHIGNFEELWLIQRLQDRRPLDDGYERMFDAVANPRPTREKLPLPEGRSLFSYLARVRDESLGGLWALDGAGLAGGALRGAAPEAAEAAEAIAAPELARQGFIFELVAEHEEQHQETLLQAMQLLSEPPYSPGQRRRLPAPGAAASGGMVEVPAGPFLMGADGEGFAYDNEQGRHEVDLPGFLIDRTPVTDEAFLAFVEEGGYRRRELWSEAGWAWREETGAAAPGNWVRADSRWHARFMDRVLPLPQGKPVVHVCFHEAEAYARFAGKRLPTEAEWEKAALWDPEAGRPRRYPWGDEPPTPARANLDQLAFEPAPAGAYPGGASFYGAEQMVGDVWEWTASDFTAYPGFAAYPYAEYSEIFFGSDYKVLRGGSWATRPAVARGTFRNWDYPIRRQIFAGFRCARDG